jgi:hypothetical protein
MEREVTRTVFKLVTIALLAATVAVPASAFAGGRISFNLAPGNQRDSALFSTGLRAYSLFRGLRDGDIRQSGNGNMAGLAQGGQGNLGFIQQQGNGHSATLRQSGNNNAYGIFQYGRNTEDDVVQNGNNGSGATFSFGW